MKYIDADKLIAKIQPLYEEAKDKSRFACQSGTSSDCAKLDKAELIYKHILHLITSLQHEQVEVDLEKEIENVKKIQMNYDFIWSANRRRKGTG